MDAHDARLGRMIKKFHVLYVGQIELDNLGLTGTPANDRRYSNERLSEVFATARDIARTMDALGYDVLRIRLYAVMFGGACAGLAGAYLPLAYTPFFIPGMTAGRGWIALALTVFASWLPGRLVIGAYLFGAVTILQLHAQALGIGVPSQFMSSLPYLATVIVLVLLSRTRRGGSTAPAALGTVFVPDR